MPLLLLLLVAVLVAQIGFWDTLTAILGAIGVVILAILIVIAIAVVAGYLWIRRVFR